jgi:hypothetical protein
VVWSYVENDSSTGDTPLVVGFQGLSTAKDLRDSCDDYSSPQTAGYTLAYAIPNAGLGTFVGVGDVYERVVPVAGKVPRREGLFIMCARVGDVAVVGWAEGTRHPGYSYNGSHADPAYSVAAQTLADFAARVEFLDKSGKPLIA